MNVQLNGERLETHSTTLDEMLVELRLDVAVVATAINGEFIARTQRAITVLQNGDVIEVLAPMQGG